MVKLNYTATSSKKLILITQKNIKQKNIHREIKLITKKQYYLIILLSKK